MAMSLQGARQETANKILTTLSKTGELSFSSWMVTLMVHTSSKCGFPLSVALTVRYTSLSRVGSSLSKVCEKRARYTLLWFLETKKLYQHKNLSTKITYESGGNFSCLRVDRELGTFTGPADKRVRDSASIIWRILVESFDLQITNKNARSSEIYKNVKYTYNYDYKWLY